MELKHTYGPIPSRRLGKSLGVDPISLKTCNWNCVYCQLGRTSPPTTERREYFPAEEIVAEIECALAQHSPGEIDWITFAGSGEPTLHSSIGWIIRRIKSMTKLPVAVITNGSLLYQPDVRHEIRAADAVLPSLDAGSEEVFLKVNRPHASLSFAQHVGGLIAFREEYDGELWVEVMLVHGLNDSEAALTDLAAVLRRARPDEVHINMPVRPPCEPWVKPAENRALRRAVTVFSEIAHVVRPVAGDFDLTGFDNVVDAILAVITRHPMSEAELVATLDLWSPGEVGEALGALRSDDRAQVVTRFGQRFWSSAGALFVDADMSRCHQGKQH